MDLLLILTYTAICVAVFKIFKIPLNKWSVPTAVLGGVVLISALMMLMNYNHPYSEMSRQYFVTTPVVPAVTGKVIEVPVQGNTLLEAGDVLFRIDPTPFEARLNSLQAQLPVSEEDVARARKLVQGNLAARRELETATARLEDLRAQLARAQFELDQTVVRAPTRGYATQVALRPGMLAAALPLRPVMVFVHDEGHYYVAWFRQNSLLRLKAGDEAEITLDAIPGVVFHGKVQTVFPALAEGQVQPTADLIDPRRAPRAGRVPVIITITDPRYQEYASRVPGGAFGQTAVYSEHFHHVAIMRKILLRMAAWMNYVFPFH